jgi:hypothetical protein
MELRATLTQKLAHVLKKVMAWRHGGGAAIKLPLLVSKQDPPDPESQHYPTESRQDDGAVGFKLVLTTGRTAAILPQESSRQL